LICSSVVFLFGCDLIAGRLDRLAAEIKQLNHNASQLFAELTRVAGEVAGVGTEIAKLRRRGDSDRAE
jgi:predicted  nucleic acid-binding Zn-ribbon protein